MQRIKKLIKHNKVTPQRFHNWEDKKISPISKNMRFSYKSYTSLIEEVLEYNISRIYINPNERLESYFKYRVYPKYYSVKIDIPNNKKVDFANSFLQTWSETKHTYKKLESYELFLFDSNELHKKFKKAEPLKKEKKLNVFVSLSMEESLMVTNDTIYARFFEIMNKRGKGGKKKKGGKNGRGTRRRVGRVEAKHSFGGGGPRWKPGPSLAAAKILSRDIWRGEYDGTGYGHTGLNINRSAYVDLKDNIKGNLHGKKTKGEYGSIAAIVQDDQPQDELIRANIQVRKLKPSRLSEILRERSGYARVQVDKPIERSEYVKAFVDKPIESKMYDSVCRKITAKKNSGRLSRKAGAGNDTKEGHPITCKVTVDLKDDSLDKNTKKKGGKHNTHGRRKSSVAASRKGSKRSKVSKVSKVRTTSHPRRKK